MRVLGHTDPCDLLSKSDLAELKIPSPGKRLDSGSSRACAWQDTQVSILITTHLHRGIDALGRSGQQGSDDVRLITINGRDARQESLAKRVCQVSVPVTGTSRVDIAVSLGDPSQTCAGAQQVARLVEPHLPSVR